MPISANRWIKSSLLLSFCCFFLLSSIAFSADLNTATKYYLEGSKLLRVKRYGKAYNSFVRAIRNLPAHKSFYCHRAQFRNYMASALIGLRKPYRAMREYYKAAYRAGCRDKKTTSYSARRYRRMYSRWMSSIHIITTPAKARVVQITKKGDKIWGSTVAGKGFKRSLLPGVYKLKVRLYEHKTVFMDLQLKAGNHKKTVLKLVKGSDPIKWKNKGGVSLPSFLASDENKKKKEDPDVVAATTKKKKTDVPLNPEITGTAGNIRNLKLDGEDKKPKKTGPPVYKKAWFWVVIGGVVVGGTAAAIFVPKPKKVLINQGKLF